MELTWSDDIVIGLLSAPICMHLTSFYADTVSNSIRVVKTTKQTSKVPMTYPEVVRVRGVMIQRIY